MADPNGKEADPSGNETRPIGNDPLLNFRLAYLRAVARSWAEPKFFDKLTDPNLDDFQKLLMRDDSHCGLKSFWPYLAIRARVDQNHEKQTRWDPVKTAGWIGISDQFIITLPDSPDALPVECHAEALAAYYQQFPHLMGPMAPASDSTTSEANQKELGALDADLGIPGGEKGTLLAFGGVVLRALALAWNHKPFLDELTLDWQAQPDAAPVLSKWLGYNNPFNFFLLFRKDQENEAGWEGKKFTWDPKTSKWQVRGKPNRIVLNLPVRPCDDHKLWPIALTSYNNTGPAYPFTCG